MHPELLAADSAVLDLLRRSESLSIGDLAESMQVTATAVRQRLNRLMGLGLVQRSIQRAGRGRPSHRYELTEDGRRRTGSNFADLAIVLWEEIRQVRDPEIRRGLLQRISARLASFYANQVGGKDRGERMEAVAALFRERRIPFEVQHERELPVLNVLACPYPDLAEQDRSICAMERMLISELVGEAMQLTSCRLDGGTCCRFEPSRN